MFVLLVVLELVIVATLFAQGLFHGYAYPARDHAVLIGGAVFVMVLSAGLCGMAVRRSWTPGPRRSASSTPRARRRFVLAGLAMALVALVVGGFALQSFYLRHRYQAQPKSLYSWAVSVHDAHIGVTSGLLDSYPLNGDDFTNTVTYLAIQGRHGADLPITDCRTFQEVINEDHDRYVVLVEDIVYPQKEKVGAQWMAWMARQPARVVLSQPILYYSGVQIRTVYAIVGRMSPSRCAVPTPSDRSSVGG